MGDWTYLDSGANWETTSTCATTNTN